MMREARIDRETARDGNSLKPSLSADHSAWPEVLATVTECKYEFGAGRALAFGIPTSKHFLIRYNYFADGGLHSSEFASAKPIPQGAICSPFATTPSRRMISARYLDQYTQHPRTHPHHPASSARSFSRSSCSQFCADATLRRVTLCIAGGNMENTGHER